MHTALLPVVNIVDLDHIIASEIEPLVQEDDYKFCLSSKHALLRKFIVYRICNMIMGVVDANRHAGSKILLYSHVMPDLVFLHEHAVFIRNMFIRISKLLSLNIYFSHVTIQDFKLLLKNNSGDGREMRNRLNFMLNKDRKAPDINAFKKLMNKHDIHHIEGDINTGYKVKLGLFVT